LIFGRIWIGTIYLRNGNGFDCFSNFSTLNLSSLERSNILKVIDFVCWRFAGVLGYFQCIEGSPVYIFFKKVRTRNPRRVSRHFVIRMWSRQSSELNAHFGHTSTSVLPTAPHWNRPNEQNEPQLLTHFPLHLPIIFITGKPLILRIILGQVTPKCVIFKMIVAPLIDVLFLTAYESTTFSGFVDLSSKTCSNFYFLFCFRFINAEWGKWSFFVALFLWMHGNPTSSACQINSAANFRKVVHFNRD